MINLRGVTASDIPIWWPKVEAWIAAALEHGPRLYSAQDVNEEARSGTMRLWLACDEQEPVGIAVTTIIQFPRRKVLVIGPVGGVQVRRWIKGLDDLIRRYAAAEGCAAQISEGRPGWDRLVGSGWAVTATQYTREIER